MLRSRRHILRLAAGAAALPIAPRIAKAQTYPARPVRIVVTTAPGSAADIHARLLGQWLSERLGQSFIIENRPGAGNNIGTEAVVRSRPDGYTLLHVTAAAAINATLYDKLSFNFIRDIAPVASLVTVANVMTVHPGFPVRSVPEFIAYAKAHPGTINTGGNPGGAGHLSSELFKMMTGASVLYIPYRGEALALTDLLAGQLQVAFATLPGSIEYVRSGHLRVLAVTTTARNKALPDIPTIGEFVPGYESSGWQGIGVPRDTPRETIELLNKEINAALADPKITARIAELGGNALSGSPAEFGKLVADETEKWARVIRAANIKPE
jgi:tripartite-type tricarboxylate transporter receptor subunit TctC